MSITMVSGTENTENLGSLIIALYENALFYQQSYFEIIFMSDIITLMSEQLDLLTEHLQVSRASSQAYG